MEDKIKILFKILEKKENYAFFRYVLFSDQSTGWSNILMNVCMYVRISDKVSCVQIDIYRCKLYLKWRDRRCPGTSEPRPEPQGK